MNNASIPTWLLIPTVSTEIDVVHVDFRLFGDRQGAVTALAGGDGGPGLMIWSLLSLLYRFLDCGPDLLSRSKIGRKVMVGAMVLNVVSPEGPAERLIPKECTLSTRRHGLVHPESIVRELEAEVGILLERSDWTARYADVVYEQIRQFRVARDGEIRAAWDLKAMKT